MHKTWQPKMVAHLGCYKCPPWRNRAPRFSGRREKGGVLGTELIFPFPSCFFIGMVRPLHLEELDRVVASTTFSFIKNPNGVLFVWEIFLEVNGRMINCTVRIFEALLELWHVENIVHFWELYQEVQGGKRLHHALLELWKDQCILAPACLWYQNDVCPSLE